MGHKIGFGVQPQHMDATPPLFLHVLTKTRATRISNTIYFKHQYITNPTVSLESHVNVAAQQLATALQGNIPGGNKTTEAY